MNRKITENSYEKRDQSDFFEGISAILTNRRYITPEDMINLEREFHTLSDRAFEDFLLESGMVEREDLLEALSQYYGVPQLDVTGAFFDHQFLRLIPINIMLRHLVIPYHRDEGSDFLWVIAADPNDQHLLYVLGKYVTHNINFMVGLPQDIRDAIREFYDQSISYQPESIANQLMERSQGEIYSPEEIDGRIPLIFEQTIDDYESD
jgi:hypothetical protein